MFSLQLAELVADIDGVTGPAGDAGAVSIRALTADSRAVTPGALFAALPGATTDGRHHIADAVARGAAAVLAPPDVTDPGVPLITADSPRRALARMAARFAGGQPRHLAAVTGTNGKTSVASFTRQLWAALGARAASLGTLGLVPEDAAVSPGPLTTPDPVALHTTLAELARTGTTHAVLEASSHGLAQERLDGLALTGAAFTNLSQDHLDYHVTMAAYRAAKRRLFAELLPAGGTAVINAEDAEGRALAETCRGRGLTTWTYGAPEGLGGAHHLLLRSRHADAAGQQLALRLLDTEVEVRLPLAGRFQALNALAAAGLVLASGAEPREVAAAMETLAGVPGRLEPVATTPAGGRLIVDYAHTPDALAHALDALRPHATGGLRVIVGCGGERDAAKRPLMGEAAAARADGVIVTDDNPRGEDPATIRRAVLTGAPAAREIGDRARAIRTAAAELGAGEVLLIAGKGHETGQTVGGTTHPFHDATVARQAAAEVAA